MDSKKVYVSDWCAQARPDAYIDVSPVGFNSAEFPRLAERATIVVSSGVARMQFNPTRAEARALIEALEWALQPVEEAEAA